MAVPLEFYREENRQGTKRLSMADYAIECKKITKTFGSVVANDQIDLKVKKGEILALLGENGSGKTTLMNMLSGIYHPDSGEILVNGQTVAINSPVDAMHLGIGMIHQHFKLVESFRAMDNIVIGTKGKRLTDKELSQKIKEICDKFGLEIEPEKRVYEMSVSEKQTVEIVKVLYKGADILILDEPTAVLTPQEIDFLLDIIKSLRDDGKTIILITHKLEEIKRIADRCAILNHGRLMDVMDVATTSTKVMANKMVGREVNFETEKEPAKPGKTILSIEKLNVYNKQDFQVVKDVSLEVHSGEIVAIAGVAGNGQVEIADAIAGLVPVRSGKILLNVRDITNLSIRERTTEGISYIPEDRQNYGLVMDFTLSENLALRNYYKEPFCHKGVLDQKIFEDNSEKLIEKYDIRSGQGSKTVVRSMSGGNQQKVILGRWLMTEPDFLILDEPTRGIDVGTKTEIQKLVVKLANEGMSVVFISSEVEEMLRTVTHMGILRDGEKVGELEESELSQENVMKAIAGGDK